MSAIEKRISPMAMPAFDRRAMLERATARRQKLQALFDNASYLDMVLRQGRYLRLCAAIAWASEREERAREALETDAMVDQLRAVSRGGAGLPAR